MAPTLLPSGYWQELTSSDFTRVDPHTTVALLPVSACEQHGPHLPLATDAIINAGVVQAMLAKPLANTSVLVLPAMTVGDSIEHTAFAGTLTVGMEALLTSWLDVGRSVARAGVRKLIIFNTHGGQRGHVDQVAVRLRVECAMLVARANSGALGKPEGLFSAEERAHGLHGGAIETSLIQHLRPDLVRQEHAANFISSALAFDSANQYLAMERGVGIGWSAQDLNKSGVCGDASAASAAKGALLLDHLATALAQLCSEVAGAPLNLLKPPASPI